MHSVESPAMSSADFVSSAWSGGTDSAAMSFCKPLSTFRAHATETTISMTTDTARLNLNPVNFPFT